MQRLLCLPMMVSLLALGGCKVTQPGFVERGAANFVKHHVTVSNRAAKSPLPQTDDTVASGKEAFGHYCVACHGKDGQNTGVPFASQLGPPVPLLTSPEVQRYTDGQLKWILDNGLFPSGMPSSRGILSDEEQWSIVLYLRHLPPAGSLGDPEMYTQ